MGLVDLLISIVWQFVCFYMVVQPAIDQVDAGEGLAVLGQRERGHMVLEPLSLQGSSGAEDISI